MVIAGCGWTVDGGGLAAGGGGGGEGDISEERAARVGALGLTGVAEF